MLIIYNKFVPKAAPALNNLRYSLHLKSILCTINMLVNIIIKAKYERKDHTLLVGIAQN